jgi:hypothetical protein
MKIKQNILVSTLIGLAAFSLAACAGAAESAPEPQQVAAVVPAQPTAPQAQPAVVVESAVSAQPAVVETHAEIEPVVSTTFVKWWSDDSLVEGAESTLVRMEHGLFASFSTTGLEPGEAVTLWWVIFNKPENCSDGECGPDDVFLMDANGQRLKDEQGKPQSNVAGRAAVQFSQLTGSGTIVDEDGRVKLLARLPVNDTNEAPAGPGLLDPMGAHVHLTIRTHGPATPGVLHEQLTTSWGGCPEGWPKDPCGNVQTSHHLPPE